MKKIILSTAVLTALLSMSTAYAGGSSSIFSDTSGGGATAAGLYGGASVGRAFEDHCTTIDYSDSDSNSDHASVDTCEESSDETAWKVFGGYKVMPNLAFEGAYIDFGTETNDDETAEISFKGVSLMGVASTSVTDNIDVFGKFGVLRWKGDAWSGESGYEVDASATGTDLAIGAGAQVGVTDNIAIRGEVEHFDDINVNLFSLGASFSTL